ncbi:uncharacterized protein TNCV_4772791 [Trichonephila clavipes]|nr:uncharacterized protein TNCV_4772791 [Trichonephila clavipes]
MAIGYFVVTASGRFFTSDLEKPTKNGQLLFNDIHNVIQCLIHIEYILKRTLFFTEKGDIFKLLKEVDRVVRYFSPMGCGASVDGDSDSQTSLEEWEKAQRRRRSILSDVSDADSENSVTFHKDIQEKALKASGFQDLDLETSRANPYVEYTFPNEIQQHCEFCVAAHFRP